MHPIAGVLCAKALPTPYSGSEYPSDLIADHLTGGFRMQLHILQSLETGEGQWGVLNDMTFITRKEWIRDELDCFRLYARPSNQF